MSRERARITIGGEVQGVGFRPFVYRLAREMRLGGWVRNDGAGGVIEVEGERVTAFVRRLGAEHPGGARIESLHRTRVPCRGEVELRIVASEGEPERPRIVPDRVTCRDCLGDVLDPMSRYHDYPFTSCTRCGPRWSIVDRLPYDRAGTAMAAFTLCDACRAEYEDPASRRFHAQPTACPACGPTASLREPTGAVVATGAAALDGAARALAQGAILALKGLGGYQLLADARDPGAVARLRARKHRPHRALAVMARDVEAARAIARVDAAEADLLASPAGPIVLVEGTDPALAATLHPCHRDIGVMLPTTALHHLLLRRAGRVLVCTSGNRSGEPLCIDDAEALERLGGIADRFLAHDRPIRRPVDDSLARVVAGAPQVLRLARGYAPLVLPLGSPGEALATGGHLKNALALGDGARAVVGPHVGDLDTTRAVRAMRAQAADLPAFFRVRPRRLACDLHPDYASSAFADGHGLPVTRVQHHLAHALAVMAEHGLDGPVLAVTWDGAGLGSDGRIWGGECLRVERGAPGVRWQRVAHLRPFRLPGGDAAAREPVRALAGLLWELPAHRARVPQPLARLLDRGLNAPWCTSAGRLFDGVAALVGHAATQTFEGMAASLVERDAWAAVRDGADAIPLAPLAALAPRDGAPVVLDWAPMLASLLEAVEAGAPAPALCRAVHRRLAHAVPALARGHGLAQVVLTGGCFQNRLLLRDCHEALGRAGLEPVIPRRLPPGDGALALGQLAALEGA